MADGVAVDGVVGELVVEVFEALDDVVADEGAVFFCDAFVEAALEAVEEHLLMGLAGGADFPEVLQAVAGGDEAVVSGDLEQGVEIL